MEIFTKLGIDHTLFLQMAIFLALYVILHPLLFKPLFDAYRQREHLTLGDEEDKAQKLATIAKLKNDYETKLRNLHTQIHDIFTKIKSETSQEYHRKILNAQKEAQRTIDQTRKRKNQEQIIAQKELEKHTPELVEMATNKILGRV